MRADIALGLKQKVFTAWLDDFLVEMHGATLMALLSMRLRGDGGPEIGSRCAEIQLAVLGAPPARAKRAAWREIEALTFRIGEE